MIVCIYILVYVCTNSENGFSCIVLFTKKRMNALKKRVLTEKSLVNKTFSEIFYNTGKIEIGRKFSGALLELFFEY